MRNLIGLVSRGRWRDDATVGRQLRLAAAAVAVALLAAACGDSPLPRSETISIAASSAVTSSSAPTTEVLSAETTTTLAQTATSFGPWDPKPLTPETKQAAEERFVQFLDALHSGDPESGIEFWSGYPGFEDEEQEFAAFLADFDWLTIEGGLGFFVVPSFGFTVASPVVTVFSVGDTLRAASFVMSLPEDGIPLLIDRLPQAWSQVGDDLPVEVGPDNTLIVEGVPTEGGARAFLGYDELEVVVDYDSSTTNIQLPDDLPADGVITFTSATPEVPAAMAIVVQTLLDS